MSESYDLVFQYLSDESIVVDKSEFLFQVKSHPDHPSLLSISDTLSFLGVHNGSLIVESSDIDHLPERFIVLLKEGQTNQELTYVKRQDEHFRIVNNKVETTLNREELEALWLEVVFLVEGSDETERPEKKKTAIPYFVAASLVLLVLLLVQAKGNALNYIFLLFPALGLVLSVTALKDLFGSEVKLISKFCKVNESTDCESVTKSSKWKIFKYLDFSDLSLVFFSTQFVAFVFMAFASQESAYFLIQKWLLLAAVPVMAVSVYYQRLVEGKWCPVCLSISAVLIMEIGYTIFLIEPAGLSKWPVDGLVLFLLVGFSLLSAWLLTKRSLKALRGLQEFQLNANRYLRAYDPFRLSLLSEERVSLPDSPVVVGQGKDLELTVITNPYCGSCKETHAVIERVLQRYSDVIRVKTIFKTNMVLDAPEVQDFHRILMTIYLKLGADKYMEALHDFFENGDTAAWNKRYGMGLEVDKDKMDLIYHYQNEWCVAQGISFTPLIYINNYKFPTAFDKDSLEFYIKDLLEDEEVCNPVAPVNEQPPVNTPPKRNTEVMV